MAQTVPGGFAITAKGAPVDANGNALSKDQITKAEEALKVKVPDEVRAKAGTAAPAGAPATAAAPGPTGADALGELTNGRLREILTSAGVEVDSKATKDDLVALVLANPGALVKALTPAPAEGE